LTLPDPFARLRVSFRNAFTLVACLVAVPCAPFTE
jgi:hypothetical protein